MLIRGCLQHLIMQALVGDIKIQLHVPTWTHLELGRSHDHPLGQQCRPSLQQLASLYLGFPGNNARKHNV